MGGNVEITISIDALEQAERCLGKVLGHVTAALAAAREPSISATYSGVSGLDQVAIQHGAVLHGGVGSAAAVLSLFHKHVIWMQATTRACRAGFGASEIDFVKELDSRTNAIAHHRYSAVPSSGADAVGAVGADLSSMDMATHLKPDIPVLPFSFAAPAVIPASSVAHLSAAFHATAIQQPTVAASAWGRIAACINSAGMELTRLISHVRARNSGLAIDAMVSALGLAGTMCGQFSSNASAMGSSVQAIAAAHLEGAAIVKSAAASIRSLPDLAAQQAAEKSFLASFPAEFGPVLMQAIPSIRILMPPGGKVGLGKAALATAASNKLSAGNLTTSIAAAGSSSRYDGGVYHFSSPTHPVSGKTEDLVTKPSGLGEAHVSAAARSMSSVLNTPETPTVPSRIPANTAAVSEGLTESGPRFGSLSYGTNLQRSPLDSLASDRVGTHPSASPGLSLTGGVFSGRNTTTRGTTSHQVCHRHLINDGTGLGKLPGQRTVAIGSLSGAPGRGSGAGGALSGSGGRSYLQSGGAAPLNGSGLSSGAIPGSGLAGPGQGGYAAASGQTAGAFLHPAQGGNRPGGGMCPATAGTRGASPSTRHGSIRTVTSRIEQEPNVRALVGDLPKVVPGVIGAWAREPEQA